MTLYEEGTLLLFHPFLFKNGAIPKDKFFIVLKNSNGELLLSCLPTSKDHVPSNYEVKYGCLEISDICVNVFIFIAKKEIAVRDDGTPFSFSKDTFIYGADLDMFKRSVFEQQVAASQTCIERVGTLNADTFKDLKECLANSKMVKNKFRRMLL